MALVSGGLPQSLRRNDYSLDEHQETVQEAFADFFTSLVPSSVVRAAEPLGFDSELWRKAKETGVVSMAVPEARGGDGATLIDLVLVAEQYGARLAPIPLVEAIAAARLLAGVNGEVAESLLVKVLAGQSLVTLALQPVAEQARVLMPAGAIADAALVLRGDELVVVSAPTSPVRVDNLAHAPLAWWDVSNGETVGRGPSVAEAYDEAVRVWKLLTAAALGGSGGTAVALGVDFASSRKAFGQFIGTFQAMSHSLVDAKILVAGSTNLTRKAAWYMENEPQAERGLVLKAFLSAGRAAVKASTVGIHVQGGFGFTNESDMTLHFGRAKGWPLLAGRPTEDLLAVADTLPDPASL
ncbi:acyl-CoA/acyl-ACP dehydrogenase [Rhodococcus fascians]|nr:acyl-CoA/acyl-ACP dehydrogenase [Rhodococcus fascians]MBY4140916.1 acyl-CoA/acyl-ACP dehydrogenase [Rhodococcus fascians]MBY4219580.1 acyl-CoA/acyl-ACP dehydrogenase [Rhodococcus fascians]MBY4221889.1 acyl-CoA/acyl-ACP dehydrogenase [Rhodococcus fascians]MBY4233890.1 acyl-CoA/acyl-ACP dehydrogenase [Rhodococcus fascians]